MTGQSLRDSRRTAAANGDLDSTVAVGFSVFDLRYAIRQRLDNCHRDSYTGVGEYSGHAALAANQTNGHCRSSWRALQKKPRSVYNRPAVWVHRPWNPLRFQRRRPRAPTSKMDAGVYGSLALRARIADTLRRIFQRPRGPGRYPPAEWAEHQTNQLVKFNLNVNAGGQFQLHQGVHGLIRGVQDVHQTLVRADFELIARILIAMRGGQYRKTLHFDGERHRTFDGRAGAFCGIDDLAGRLIDQSMIVGLQADTYVLISHVYLTLLGADAAPS